MKRPTRSRVRRFLRTLRVSTLGVEFTYKGDGVIYLWPWLRAPDCKPWLSLGFSGTGEFGDARFSSLAELDAAWHEAFSKFEYQVPPS